MKFIGIVPILAALVSLSGSAAGVPGVVSHDPVASEGLREAKSAVDIAELTTDGSDPLATTTKTAGSHGDTHFETFGGHKYDFP